jgi:translation initiation factor IF-2
MVVPVSAKQKKGLDDLLEGINLVADSVDIKANPEGKVFGTVVEAELDRSKGVIATLLVQNGSLELGDVVVAGQAMGRLRAMFDFRGRRIRKGGPSTPVSVMGLDSVPQAGEMFQVYPSEKEARVVLEDLKQKHNLAMQAPKATLEELFDRFQAGEVRELRLIIKADVQGSLEPIITSLTEMNKGDISINVLYAETGNVGDNDILLASASKAIVVGFNVQAETNARRLAEAEGVSIRLYEIIYRLTEDVEKALKGMLAPEYKDVTIGRANVQAVFRLSKAGNVAGCKVTEGELRRNADVRLLRNSQVVFDGEMASLRHEKEDVREVRPGFECGVALKGFNDFVVGDVIECYARERVVPR